MLLCGKAFIFQWCMSMIVQYFSVRAVTRIIMTLVAAFSITTTAAIETSYASSRDTHAFGMLNGWWIGFGRLGFQNGKTEQVKCRATYHLNEEDGSDIRQVLRCASASGNVEIESKIKRDGDALTGSWREKKYNFSGKITGKISPTGFRVNVRGSDHKAAMDITVKEDKHVVEIQFLESTLLGLSMIFKRK